MTLHDTSTHGTFFEIICEARSHSAVGHGELALAKQGNQGQITETHSVEIPMRTNRARGERLYSRGCPTRRVVRLWHARFLRRPRLYVVVTGEHFAEVLAAAPAAYCSRSETR